MEQNDVLLRYLAETRDNARCIRLEQDFRDYSANYDLCIESFQEGLLRRDYALAKDSLSQALESVSLALKLDLPEVYAGAAKERFRLAEMCLPQIREIVSRLDSSLKKQSQRPIIQRSVTNT